MWSELTRDQLSALLFLMANLVDKKRTIEIIHDINFADPVVTEYAELLAMPQQEALTILRTYGNFFMEMIDAKVRTNHRRLIGSLTGDLPFTEYKEQGADHDNL